MWHSGSQQVIFRQVKLKFGSPQINFAVCRSLDAGGVGNCGYTKETEEKAIAEGHADLISFGRPLHQRPGPRGALQERLAAIEEIYSEGGVFYDPTSGAHRGRDEIDRVAGAIRATHPDFRYQPIAEPEELGNGGRLKWVSGRPGEAPTYAGTDFIIVLDGRIAALYLFFDRLP